MQKVLSCVLLNPGSVPCIRSYCVPPWHRCGLHLAQTHEVWPETWWHTMPSSTLSPCPMAALSSTVLTGVRGHFRALCPLPLPGVPCSAPPTHSCGRDLSGIDLWGSCCPYLAECHYWQWNQPCQWACCRWRGSSCSQWTACCALGNPQASWGHHQAGEGQLGPKIWRNKEMIIISCK